MRRTALGARLLDTGALALWRGRLLLRRQLRQVSGDAGRLIYARPSAIGDALWRRQVLAELGLRRQRDLVGFVRGGDWDLERFPLDRLGIFEAVRLRFEEGMPWDQIPYFREMARAVEAGRPQFKYRSPADIPRQWQRIDELYERIRTGGYRSQQELRSARPWDEVTVAIDRDGRLLFLDGRHRLAIARVLRCERIPLLVGLRHRDWQERREDLRRGLADGPHPAPHPDLAAEP
jgi:hypothetical protein